MVRPLAPGFVVLLLFPVATHAKFVSGQVRISGTRRENHWKYLSKFGFVTGTGNFSARVRLHMPKTISTPVNLKFELFLDEHWPAVEAETDVCERRKHAKQARDITLNSDGTWGDWIDGSLTQSVRPHIWFFALSDCDQLLNNFTHRIKFEFHAQQPGGSEFSVEMRWLLPINCLFLLGFSIYTWWVYTRAVSFRRSAGSLHPVIWILFVGVMVHFIAQLSHTIHLVRYSRDGSGFKALEVLSEVFFMLSQVMQTSLLILIALGYTLLQSCLGDLDLMIPVFLMVGIVHLMLVVFGKLKDDESYKYHENEGAVGWIILIIRLLLYALFVWAVQSSAKEGGARLRNFLRQFGVAGTIYFLAYPILFLVTQLFAPYLQHCIFSVGVMTMQASSNVWMSMLFLTRGEYFRVSTLSDSALPGGVKIGMTKEE